MYTFAHSNSGVGASQENETTKKVKANLLQMTLADTFASEVGKLPFYNSGQLLLTPWGNPPF